MGRNAFGVVSIARHVCINVCITVLAILCLNTAYALEPVSGNVLLVIDGNIDKSNASRNNVPIAEFDRELLESMDSTTISTSTPWTGDDIAEFTGVRISTLPNKLGVSANDAVLRATGADDYWFELSDMDFDKYPIIVAFAKNGERMSVRELGPLWIIFPWDDFPELLTEKSKASSVWQLIELTVE